MVLLFLFLVGFGFAVTGGVSIIAYMNFLPVGVSWTDYIVFIVGRPECYFLPIGVLLMSIALFRYPNNL
ncbi:hypothetical protein GCM10007063_17290 [Lentibacillus kapialis]|uniref:Uncharacterized protein n=1 Tax=Lentibacillus kapialis TaxID=340214 RepID=A0A917PWJ5_9BACI|nr:hypothetical protein [Lentibacillus kapialis]GGJ95308.1 hypothetical protein GCM10007063_17290 [Lentibacillus kapialis]